MYDTQNFTETTLGFFLFFVFFFSFRAVVGLSLTDCAVRCEIVYEPVCGSDGRTYKNRCFLMRENCMRKIHELNVIHKGECDEEAEEDEQGDNTQYVQGYYRRTLLSFDYSFAKETLRPISILRVNR